MSSTSSRSEARLIDGLRFERLGVDHRLADVAQVIVDRMGQQMDGGRLPVAGEDDARGRGALAGRWRRRRSTFAARGTAAVPNRQTPKPAAIARARLSISLRAQRQAMVGLGPGAADARLDHIQPVHLRFRRRLSSCARAAAP